MAKQITIIGAGIVGIATACYLRRDGHEVTVVDMNPPGEYCSFGNAGILSPGSCVPQALPGILWKVPGYLADPAGPLTVRWGHLPRALPWLLKFIANSRLDRVVRSADGLRALLRHTFDAYEPLVKHAGISGLIHRSGYLVVYESEKAYRGDALAWKLRRDRGVVMKEFDSAAIQRIAPALARIYPRGLYLPEQGHVANPGRLTQALAAQFQRDGGEILQRKVLDIERSPMGPIALMTGAGRLAVKTLVVCAGAHSAEITSMLGETLPLEAERGYHVTLPEPGMKLPLPVIGPSAKFGDVYYAFGHGHVGLCGAAPTGRIIADLVAGRRPPIDISPYRPGRFS